jgi:hypothetical protein
MSSNSDVSKKIFVEALRTEDLTAARTILNTYNDDDCMYYSGMSMYHYLVIYSIYYDEKTIKELCNLFREYESKLGDICKKADGTSYIEYKKKEGDGNIYSIEYTDYKQYVHSSTTINAGTRAQYTTVVYYDKKNCFQLVKLTPITFAQQLKVFFKEVNWQSLDIVISFLGEVFNKRGNQLLVSLGKVA